MYKIVLALLLTIGFSGIATAQSTEKYVAEVNIDITAEDAASAREKGMKEAYRKAFLTIAGKSTDSEGLALLSELTDGQLVNFVQEATVVSEKASDVRYIAQLKVRINHDLLKAYMEEQGINYVIRTASNIIVIPVFREFSSDSPLLWESRNEWRKAWEQTPNTGSENNYISIPADSMVYSVLDGNKALQLNGQALDLVASHLNTRNIYVLDAVYNGIEGLRINIMPYNGSPAKTIDVSGERSPDLFKKAIPEVAAYIDSTIQEQNFASDTSRQELIGMFSYQKLSDWIKTENQLKNIPQISSVKIEAMGKGKVQFRLEYMGQLSNLSTALKAYRLNLQDMNGYYHLTTGV